MDAKSAVHVVNGDIFYSPNCTRKFTLPVPGEDVNLFHDLKHAALPIGSLQHPRWWTPPTEWLGFVPCLPVLFAGRLLEKLAFIPRRMFSHQGGFMMPPYLVTEWVELDELLAKITKDLAKKYQLPVWWPHSPSHSSYHKPHPTQREAQDKAALGRDWFGLWIGLLFWMTRKIPDPKFIENITAPIWFSHAVILGFRQTLWDGLRTAPLLNPHFITERVGLILPYPESLNQPAVSWFVSSGVPVWYRWGPREVHGLAQDSNFRLEPPPEWQIQQATTWFTRSPPSFETAVPESSYYSPPHSTSFETFTEPQIFSPGPPPPSTSLETSTEPQTFSPASPPPVVPDAGIPQGIPQRDDPMEVLNNFFQKRQARNARLLEKETAVDRQRRMSREKNPPTVSAPVYVWDWDFDHSHLYTRTLSRVANRESTLQSYGHDQKRYDPFFNEWNCSDMLGEAYEAGDEVDDNWRTMNENPADFPYQLFQADPEVDSLLRVTRLYYGFVPPLPLPDRVPEECKPVECLRTAVLTGIPEAKENLAFFNQPTVRLCVKFLRHFWQAPLLKPPVESWDVFLSNRLCVASSQRIHTIQTVVTEKGESLYMFNFGSLSTVPWRISVHSAAVALLICRLPSALADENDIATYLVKNGIKFRTLRLSSDLRSAPQERHHPMLTRLRVATDKFSAADYDSYLQDVATFVRQRHGRAALLAGGILWRITKDLLSFSDALNGPLARYSGMFTATDTNGNEYVDDALTEEETDFLCGLYTKCTGEFNPKAN